LRIVSTISGVALLCGLVYAGIASAQAFGQAGNDPSSGPDVLIVYSTGNVRTGTMKADAVTTPTPATENMKTVAEKLATALTARKISAKAVLASEVKTYEEIMKPSVLVLGSPAYFNNASWQFMKFIDELFWPIWLDTNKLQNHKAAAFAMADHEQSCHKVNEIIRALVTNARGTFGPTMVVVGNNTPEQVNQAVEKFAGEIESFGK
jgi:flavodoxin